MPLPFGVSPVGCALSVAKPSGSPSANSKSPSSQDPSSGAVVSAAASVAHQDLVIPQPRIQGAWPAVGGLAAMVAYLKVGSCFGFLGQGAGLFNPDFTHPD